MSTDASLFQRAKALFLHFAQPLRLEERYPGQSLLERLTTPDKSIRYRISLQMDSGEIRVYDAYRVQFNDDLGPYKGGLRFHPKVTLDEMTAMAFWMYLKTAVVGIPFGGAKGGISVDYPALSMAERERLTKKFAIMLANDVGRDTDIPAPDVNTGAREMGWMLHAWRMTSGHYDRGMITGKPLDLGGSRGRVEATGCGVVITLIEAARDLGIDPEGATAAVKGFGKVGRHSAFELARRGSKVIAVSDAAGAVYNPCGLDLHALAEHSDRTGSVANFPGGKSIDHREVLCADCDFLVPAALEDAITADLAPLLKALGLPAVALVPPPGLKPPPAALAEADPRSRPFPAGRSLPVGCKMPWSHGRCLLPWGSPGRSRILLGHLDRSRLSPRQSRTTGSGCPNWTKETRNQTALRCALPEADREGDAAAKGHSGRKAAKKLPGDDDDQPENEDVLQPVTRRACSGSGRSR